MKQFFIKHQCTRLLLALLLVVGFATNAHAYRWNYGADEFDPSENKSGTAYTVYTVGSYEVTFSLLTYCVGAIKDAWAREICVYASPASAKDDSQYEMILKVYSLGHSEENKLKYYSTEFKMGVQAMPGTGVFIAPNGKSVQSIGTDTQHAKDTITFSHHKGDETAYAELKWVPAQSWTGRQVKFMVKVYETNHALGDHHFTYYPKGIFTTSSYELQRVGRPMLMEPTMCEMPGKLQLTYFASDSVVEYTIHRYHTDWRKEGQQAPVVTQKATKEKPIPTTNAIVIDADDYSYRVDAFFKLSRSGVVTDTIHALPYDMVYPAFHPIWNFKVEPQVDTEGAYAGIYRGYKKLTWEVHHVDHEDVYEDDMFEIQRAYDPNFKTAQTVAIIPFNDPDYSRREPQWIVDVEKFPCQIYTYLDTVPQAVNSDSIKTPIHYRIRRMSTSLFKNQWPDNGYSGRGTVQSPVFLAMPYINDETPIFSLAEDYATNRAVNIRVPFTPNVCEGHYFWWDKAAHVILTRYWSGIPTADNPKPEIQKADILMPQESMVYENGRWYLKYTDKPNFPCVNYAYSVRVERGGAVLPLITYDNVNTNDTINTNDSIR